MSEKERQFWRTQASPKIPVTTLEGAMALTITSLDPTQLYIEDTDVETPSVACTDKQEVEKKVNKKFYLV